MELTITLVGNVTHPTLHVYIYISFITGVVNKTVCFHCGCCLKDWAEVDDPFDEHRVWFPNCVYIRYMERQRTVPPATRPHFARTCTLMWNVTYLSYGNKFGKRKDVSNTHSTGGTLLTGKTVCSPTLDEYSRWRLEGDVAAAATVAATGVDEKLKHKKHF
jgi:hypothetical protein